ncbi:MAG TPA: serine hydrolase domain-containing protein, partial [Burkholderiaceae bacterium]
MPHPIHLSPALLFPLMVLQCSAVQAGETQAQWLNAQRLAWNIPGVAIATIAPGTAPEVLASGLCNVEANQACAADSQFQIGSITKFFTGLTAATLAADKALRLDEPVALRWPGFRLADARWTEVTLRDLLSGRSGIGAVDWPYFWDPALTRRDYLARLRHQPLVRPFRAGWTYSNANFVAAGSYLEQMTGS